MIDPDDKNTRKLDLPEPAERITNNSNVTSIVEPRLEERAIELGLVRERRPVFVFDPRETKQRGGSADRMAKLRDKQAAAGLRPAAVPVALLAEVKEAGGWEAWQAKKTAPPAPAPVEVPGPERVVVQTVEVPIKLGNRDTASLNLGRKIEALTGWKAAVLRWLLNSTKGE